jgi:serine/threonine protein kinase
MEAVAIEPQETPESLHVSGELIDGKYRLERELGAGAMGRVWLARNAMLDLPVAIKIVDIQQHGREAVARVLAEARLLAQLSHPNIVRVLDCHSDEGAAYVVMELLEGCTLAELMDEGPLPAALVVRLVVPLLDALATAHRDGVVHRDIKPDNIFVARRGQRICPKLLDFGIARSGAASTTPNHDKRLIVGTPGYMSPEQALGDDEVDHRADIWAMGVVMYEAISGGSAFQCTSYANYLRALRERKLVPLNGEGAVGLWMVLQRAMSRASEERFASANEFAATLRLWLRARGLREDLKGDSLPEHWAAMGSVVHRAWRSSARRSLATERAEASGRRRIMPGSATLVDPRVPVHVEASLRTWARNGGNAAKRPLVLWAAVATVLCATVAMLHARADAGNASQNKQRRLGSLQAVATTPPQLSAAEPRYDSPDAELAASLQPSAPEQLPAAEPPHKSGVRRVTARRSHAAHSGSGNRVTADARRAEISKLGLKTPW